MLPDNFEQLLCAYLDGELSGDELHQFEALARTNADVRARIDSERRMNAMFDRFLSQPISLEDRHRILTRFRRAVAEEDLRSPESAAPVRRRSLSFFRAPAMRWAAAAAIIIAALIYFELPERSERVPMTGTVRDRFASVNHSHSSLLTQTHHEAIVFWTDLGYTDKSSHFEFQRARGLLTKQPCGRAWCSVECKKLSKDQRMAECNRILREICPKSCELPTFRGESEIVGFRMVKVAVGDQTYDVPHFVVVSKDGEEVSVFAFAQDNAPEIFASLRECRHPQSIEIGLHECPDCRMVARRCGSYVLVIVSCEPYERVRLIAKEL